MQHQGQHNQKEAAIDSPREATAFWSQCHKSSAHGGPGISRDLTHGSDECAPGQGTEKQDAFYPSHDPQHNEDIHRLWKAVPMAQGHALPWQSAVLCASPSPSIRSENILKIILGMTPVNIYM